MHDEKFIDIFSDKYFYKNIKNTILLLKNASNYHGKHKEQLISITPFSKKYFEFLNSDLNYELIIVYNLDYEKAYLVNHLHKKISTKYIWNFFGTELYNSARFSFIKSLYGSFTKELIQNSVGKDRKRVFRFIKYLMKSRLVPHREIEIAMHKIDYFAWYSNEEYNYLKAEVPYIPKFLKYPFENLIKESTLSETHIKNQILLGNSRGPENNHLDILMQLENVNYKGEILIPFSYGSDSHYAIQLKERIKSLNIKVRLLEEFLPYGLYLRHISSCEMAIFYSFRQMALGNILVSIVAGSKVYLSEKNISYTWLKNIGFKIFSVERDLKKDVEMGKKSLTEEEWQTNRTVYYQLTNKKNVYDFLKLLPELI